MPYTFKNIYYPCFGAYKQMINPQAQCCISGEVFRCFLNCQNSHQSYSFSLRLGGKVSDSSRKKTSINLKLIEFNEKIQLKVTQEDMQSNHKCEVLLFRYKPNNQKEIFAIASVHINDLAKKERRKLRLINNVDKSALIELKIFRENLTVEQSMNGADKKQKQINQMHQKSKSQVKKSVTQTAIKQQQNGSETANNDREIRQDISQISETKTCPNYIRQQSPQIIKEKRFNRSHQKSQSGRSFEGKERNGGQKMYTFPCSQGFNGLNIDSLLKEERLCDDKKRANRDMYIRFKKSELFEELIDSNKNSKISYDSTKKAEERMQKLNSLTKIYTENIEVMQKDNPNRKNSSKLQVISSELSLNKVMNLHLSFTKKKNLRFHPGVVDFSIKFDHKDKVLIERETNTQAKPVLNQFTETIQVETRNFKTDVDDLVKLIESGIQTQIQLAKKFLNQLTMTDEVISESKPKIEQVELKEKQQCVQIEKKVASVQKNMIEKKLSIDSETNIQILLNQAQHKKLKQKNYADQYTQTQQTAKSSIQKLQLQSQINDLSSQKQTYSDKIFKQSQKSTKVVIDPIIGSGKESMIEEHKDYDQLKSQSKSKLSNQSFSKKEGEQFEKLIVVRDFKLVRTVGMCIRSLKDRIRQIPINNLKTHERPKSKFEKVGFLQKINSNDNIKSIEQIPEMNESMLQSRAKQSPVLLIAPDRSSQSKSPQTIPKEQNVSGSSVFSNLMSKLRSTEYKFRIKDQKDQDFDESVEISSQEDEFSDDSDEQFDKKRYSNQQDKKQAKHIGNKKDWQEFKKANKLLQKTNQSISDQLKEIENSFLSFKQDTQKSKVSKEEHNRMKEQLFSVHQQLKSLEMDRLILIQQKQNLQQSHKQMTLTLQKMKQENNILNKNFKQLKIQYHLLQSQYTELQKAQKTMKESKKKLTIDECFERTQMRKKSEVNFNDIRMTESYIPRDQSNAEGSHVLLRNSSKRTSLAFKLDTLTTPKNQETEIPLKTPGSTKNFRSFVEMNVKPKQDKGAPTLKNSASMIVPKSSKSGMSSWKMFSRQNSFTSQLHSLQIEDFISQEKFTS